MFDIIVDFPDSLPALHDLQKCLLRTYKHTHLVASMRDGKRSLACAHVRAHLNGAVHTRARH